MILYIDSTDFNKAVFGLYFPSLKKIKKQVYKLKPDESFKTLGFLDKFLTLSFDRVTPSDDGVKSKIRKIVVNRGPGSYTGVRVGVTIAQALGFAWNIPVRAVGKDKFKII